MTRAAAFVGLYLAFLVLGLPAGRALDAAAAMGAPIDHGFARGTLLGARASGLAIAGHPVGAFEWRLAPAALLSGCAELRFFGGDGAGLHARGALGACLDGRRYLRDARLQADAAVLAGRLGLAALAAGGDLRVRIERLERRAGSVRGHGAGRWRAARIAVPEDLALGTVAASFAPRGDGLHGTVSGRGGAVDLDAEIALDGGGEVALEGRLRGRGDAVNGILGRLLVADESGAFPVSLRRRLAVP